MTRPHISLRPLKLAWPSRPTMMWSCTTMPIAFATAMILRVMVLSAWLGVGSPDGWSTVPTCCTSSAIRAFYLSRNRIRNRSKASKDMAAQQSSITAVQLPGTARFVTCPLARRWPAAAMIPRSAATAPDAGHLDQQMPRHGNNFGEGSESADQLLRNRRRAAPRDRAEQHRFDQFVIGQSISPAVRKRSRSRSRCPRSCRSGARSDAIAAGRHGISPACRADSQARQETA